MPAQIYQIRRRRRKPARFNFKISSFLKLILILVLGVLIVFFLVAGRSREDKIFIAKADLGRENVEVLIFDFERSEIIRILIPGNVEVEVAENFGRWKTGVVWDLGVKEKKRYLLAKSLSKNFFFPIYHWVDPSFSWKSFKDIFEFLLNRRSFSNLDFGQRLKVLKLSLLKKEETRIDLKDTSILNPRKLIDGEMGYVVNEKNSPSFLASYFLNPYPQSSGFKVLLIDKSGEMGLAERVGKIVEVLGADIVSVEREKKDEYLACLIRGRGYYSEFLSKIFACRLDLRTVPDSVDLEFEIGARFISNF